MPIYLWTFILVVVALLVWGLKERGRIIEFPFLAGVAFAGFVLPQLVGLSNNAVMLPPNALDRLLLMSTLCAAMCLAGYVAASREWDGFGWRFNRVQLQGVAWVLLVVGLVFWSLIYSLPQEELNQGGWSGIEVAYLFIARLTKYAFAIGLLLYLYHRNRTTLILTLLAALPTVYRAVFLGRRAAMAEFALGVVIAVWLIREKLPPRWVFAPIMIIAMLMASFSAGDYRTRALDSDGLLVSEIGSIPWLENVQHVLNTGGTELPNALYSMDIAAHDGLYDYGASAWDYMVFSYVPAQVFGAGLKESLYLRWGVIPSERQAEIEWRFGYQRSVGSTATGITDSFLSFGYLGAFKFFFIAWSMAHIHAAARKGDLVAQIIYLLLAVPAMHAVTHTTFWYIQDWPHMVVFLLPALAYARVPMRQQRRVFEGKFSHSLP